MSRSSKGAGKKDGLARSNSQRCLLFIISNTNTNNRDVPVSDPTGWNEEPWKLLAADDETDLAWNQSLISYRRNRLDFFDHQLLEAKQPQESSVSLTAATQHLPFGQTHISIPPSSQEPLEGPPVVVQPEWLNQPPQLHPQQHQPPQQQQQQRQPDQLPQQNHSRTQPSG